MGRGCTLVDDQTLNLVNVGAFGSFYRLCRGIIGGYRFQFESDFQTINGVDVRVITYEWPVLAEF